MKKRTSCSGPSRPCQPLPVLDSLVLILRGHMSSITQLCGYIHLSPPCMMPLVLPTSVNFSSFILNISQSEDTGPSTDSLDVSWPVLLSTWNKDVKLLNFLKFYFYFLYMNVFLIMSIYHMYAGARSGLTDHSEVLCSCQNWTGSFGRRVRALNWWSNSLAPMIPFKLTF